MSPLTSKRPSTTRVSSYPKLVNSRSPAPSVVGSHQRDSFSFCLRRIHSSRYFRTYVILNQALVSLHRGIKH